MTTIDEQNAKQIRQPMQVEISVALADPGNPLTYSGYAATAKVADGVLGQRSWPMRQLADLQGDGFPLDGSRELYETKTASQATGKLGVRGHVGQDADVTISRSRTIPSVEIRASGASAVVYGGTAYSLETGSASILIGATSATLTFVPKDATVRAEVSYIGSTTEFVIRNDTLIRAVVSLRSDLSLYGQTLPESEINIEAFVSADVSEYVATVPSDTPIIYRAGYEDDMSDDRKFYVAGQVTWADNILSIHAVDAVHFLDDVEIPAPATEYDTVYVIEAARGLLSSAGVDWDELYSSSRWGVHDNKNYRFVLPKGTKARDYIALLNQHFNITDDAGKVLPTSYVTLGGPLQFAYVDAGRPFLRDAFYDVWVGTWDVNEDDCADVKKNVERPKNRVTATWQKITNPTLPDGDPYAKKIGTATITKYVGTTLSFDCLAYAWVVGLYLGRTTENEVAQKMMNRYGYLGGLWSVLPVVPCAKDGNFYGSANPWLGSLYLLNESGLTQEEFAPAGSARASYAAFVPWSQSYDGWRYDTDPSHLITSASQMWNVLTDAGVIAANAESIDLDIYGIAVNLDAQSVAYTRSIDGDTVDLGDAPIIGTIAAKTSSNSSYTIYPQQMLRTPMWRSVITGSFTWKGDPRMQPRDRCRFTRLDGTVEEITLENITITHEGGGTSAEITYRKGFI